MTGVLGLCLFAGTVASLAPWRSAALAEDASVRRWTDTSGKFQIQAALVDVKDGKAVLKREGGDEVSVLLSMLSRSDQQYVREEMSRRRASRASNETSTSRTDRGSSSSNSDWPQWRGPNRDGISSSTGLIDQWPAEGPPLAWQVRGLGSGFASVAISDGKIYTQGKRATTQLICLNESDGAELWRAELGGGNDPTGTPTVAGDLVVAEDNDGNLLCANAQTGEKLWSKNFGQDFGAQRPTWGFSESPLVDGDRVICTPGSDNAVMAALDIRTGNVIWSCALPREARGQGHGGAGYSSPVVSHGGGIKQYVQLMGNGVIGVRAEDGKFLWGYSRIANGTANIPTPIVSGDFVFCASGYDAGSALLRLVRRGSDVAAQEVYFLDGRTFQNHHGGMVLKDGYVYSGHKHNQGFPICLEMKTGKIMWGGEMRGPGTGSAAITYADGNLIYRYQDGKVALIEATPREYRLISQFTPVHKDRESWAHPVVVGGKLYLREQDVLMCYDLRQ
jgi:outer membrane protein assembly factor BamB